MKQPGREYDQDADGYGDISLTELHSELVKAGVIDKTSVPADLAKALLSRKRPNNLIYFPPVLVPYGSPNKTALGKPPAAEIYQVGLATKRFHAITSIDLLMPRLTEYFNEFFVHVDDAHLKGVNASEKLEISLKTDLANYFSFFDSANIKS